MANEPQEQKLHLEGGSLWGLPSGDYILESDMTVVRAYFRRERDEQLGRWRWPENPDYVVYPGPVDAAFERMFGPGVQSVILRESDGMTKGFVQAEDEGAPARWPHVDAARAYFAAHPEPKPWHTPKPGDVWVLTFNYEGGGGTLPFGFYNGKFNPTGHYTNDIDPLDSTIVAATRIFPPAEES